MIFSPIITSHSGGYDKQCIILIDYAVLYSEQNDNLTYVTLIFKQTSVTLT